MRIELSPRRALQLLLAAVALLGAADVATRLLVFGWGLSPELYPLKLFDFNAEGNLPALFSGFLHLGAALALAVAASASRSASGPWRLWAGLSAVFCFLATDEWLGFHERLTHLFKGTGVARGVFYFAWVIPYGLATLALGVAYLRFVLALPPRTRNLFFASAALFLAGAVGCELVSGPIVEDLGRGHPAFAAEVFVEETLEMCGMSLFIYAVLDHLRAAFPGARLDVSVR